MSFRTTCRMAVLAGVSVGSIVSALAQNITGPSSSQSPYVVSAQPGVVTVSILTVGDAVNYKADGVTPYRMVGIPDGLGAFDNGDGTFTVLINHELASNTNGPVGIIRDHGFAGAFVSKWIIDKSSLTVLHGQDLMKNVYAWDTNTCAYGPQTSAMLRFCSADLPQISAFYNASTGRGYN
jgi:hypothetical protein